MPIKSGAKKRKIIKKGRSASGNVFNYKKNIKALGPIFLSYRAKVIIVCFLLAMILLIPFIRIKKIQAEEIVFYPGICVGNWHNATNIAGDPNDKELSADNIAKPTGNEQKIICSDFSGNLPPNVTILSADLEFIWVKDDFKKNDKEELPLEESFDQPVGITETVTPTDESIITPEVSPQEQVPQVITPTEEDTPSKPLILPKDKFKILFY